MSSRIRVIASSADRALAVELTNTLASGGFDLSKDGDAVVVIMSGGALHDSFWREEVADAGDVRLIPVAVGHLDDNLVPDPLRPVNWIHWRDDAGSTGQLLAAANYSPERYRVSAQLTNEAQAWENQGRPKTALVSDDRRLRELRISLRADPSSALLPLNPTTRSYVEQSIIASKRSRKRKRIRRWGLIVLVLVVASVAIPRILSLRFSREVNRATFVAGSGPEVGRDNIEWARLQAATVVVNGDETAMPLAEGALRELITRNWSIGRVGNIGASIEGADTMQDGLAFLAVLGDDSDEWRLAVIDLRDSEIITEVPLPGRFNNVTIAQDGTVMVSGRDGAVTVDLASETSEVVTGESVLEAAFDDDGRIALALTDRVVLFDAAGNEVSSIETPDRVLAMSVSPTGVGVLTFAEPNTYRETDLGTGRVQLEANLAPGFTPAGGVDPGEPVVFVTGPGNQVWRLSRGTTPMPTGIPAADSTNLILPLSDRRLLVGSQSAGLRVFDAATGVELGEVCREVHNVRRVSIDASGEFVACLGLRNNTVWRIPDGPIDNVKSAVAAEATQWLVESQGTQVRAVPPDGTPTAWTETGIPRVASTSIDETGQRVAVGGANGMVVLYDRSGTELLSSSRWQTPDHSSVAEFRWFPELIAETASGLWWEIPDCAGCGTRQGLLQHYRDMRKPCVQPNNLVGVDTDTRVTLQVFMCEDSS